VLKLELVRYWYNAWQHGCGRQTIRAVGRFLQRATLGDEDVPPGSMHRFCLAAFTPRQAIVLKV